LFLGFAGLFRRCGRWEASKSAYAGFWMGLDGGNGAGACAGFWMGLAEDWVWGRAASR